LDLQILVPGDAFNDPALFYEQLEFAWLIGVRSVAVEIGCEVDAAGRDPVPFDDALVGNVFRLFQLFQLSELVTYVRA
jgi:hypothetical protein